MTTGTIKKNEKIIMDCGKYLYFEGVLSDDTWRPENSDCVLRPQAYLH
jgi:hypothetical protein